MDWKIGQKLACDRPEQYLSGCVVVSQEDGSVVISCPAVGIVVRGHQQELERFGWQIDENQPETAHEPKDLGSYY
jgi:hypothetical protein